MTRDGTQLSDEAPGAKTAMGTVYQINVSPGGVPKRPVPKARISAAGVEGDHQRTPKVHGGPDRAVCVFSLELIRALQEEGHQIEPGASGENLTLAGLDWSHLVPGARLRVGDAVVLELTSYTDPCAHNARWFREGNVRRISQRHHPGWSRLYARVLSEGVVRTGDVAVVEQEGKQ